MFLSILHLTVSELLIIHMDNFRSISVEKWFQTNDEWNDPEFRSYIIVCLA